MKIYIIILYNSGFLFLERRHSPKREIAKEFHSTQFSTPAMNLPFYQHGDVAFVELPADFDLRTGKTNAARSYSNAKVTFLNLKLHKIDEESFNSFT